MSHSTSIQPAWLQSFPHPRRLILPQAYLLLCRKEFLHITVLGQHLFPASHNDPILSLGIKSDHKFWLLDELGLPSAPGTVLTNTIYWSITSKVVGFLLCVFLLDEVLYKC